MANVHVGRRFGPGEWLLAGLAWIVLGIVRLLLIVVPFKHLMGLLGLRLASDMAQSHADAPVPISPDDPAARRLSWAIAAAMRRTPWESKCLAQALAGATILRVSREPARVYFGVRPADPSTGRQMTAHAWLVSRGLILTGAPEHDTHAVVAVYSLAE